MKLELTPTDMFETVDGVPHRVWTGVTDSGVPVRAGVRYVQPQTHDEDALEEFETELQALPTPRMGAIDWRFLS